MGVPVSLIAWKGRGREGGRWEIRKTSVPLMKEDSLTVLFVHLEPS